MKYHKQKVCGSKKDRDESHLASDELFASFLAEVEAEVGHGDIELAWKHSLFGLRQTSQLSHRPSSARCEQFDHVVSAQIVPFAVRAKEKAFPD